MKDILKTIAFCAVFFPTMWFFYCFDVIADEYLSSGATSFWGWLWS